ncbi:MAG TPA: hypothetical protein VJ770_21745 [Stellaceae bacterium]|nr:hypothetical protein [Stellaceae bacterium]
MKKLLAGVAVLPFLAGIAMAGQPAPLNDTQMDQVTAGLAVWFVPSLGAFVVSGAGGTVNPGPGVLVANFTNLDGEPGFPSVTVGRTTITRGTTP